MLCEFCLLQTQLKKKRNQQKQTGFKLTIRNFNRIVTNDPYIKFLSSKIFGKKMSNFFHYKLRAKKNKTKQKQKQRQICDDAAKWNNNNNNNGNTSSNIFELKKF